MTPAPPARVPLSADDITGPLRQMFPEEWLRQTARATGLIKRERKIDPVAFFWILVLSYSVQVQRTLVALKDSYRVQTGHTLSDGSWYERFSPELVRFLHACVVRGMEQLAASSHQPLAPRLERFQDILIHDTTVFRLHAKLAKKWPATRTRVPAAGVKVGTLLSVIANGPKRVAIYGERTGEIHTLRVGPWVKDRLLLFDLGFYKFQLFARIGENGGSFVSRLKDSSDPLLLGSLTVHRGRAVDLAGKRWKEVQPRLRREVLDAQVELTMTRRAYRGARKKEPLRLRLVAVYNEEARRYHVYLTNIPPEELTAEEVASLYACRWEIELVFKELKSRYALDKVKTTNPQVVEALIWTAFLTMVVSRRLYTLSWHRLSPEKRPRLTRQRWAKRFVDRASVLLRGVLKACQIDYDWNLATAFDESEALDPHVNRERLQDRWSA